MSYLLLLITAFAGAAPLRGGTAAPQPIAFITDRPRLHFRLKELAEIRREIHTTRKRYFKNLLAWLQSRKTWSPPSDTPQGTLNEVQLETAGAFVTNAALAAVLTEDPQIVALAKSWALRMARGAALRPRNYGYGAYAAGLARAYDWLHAEFNDQEKETIRGTLARLAGALYKGSFRERRSHFWWAGCYLHHDFWIPTAGYGEAALALVGEVPQAALWACRAREEFEEIFRYLGTDGAWHEGPADWCYALAPLLWFYSAWETAAGEDLHRRPWLRNTALYRLYHRLPDGSYIALDDSFRCGRYNTSGSAACHLLRRLASVFKDGFAQWLADQEEPFDLKPGPKGVPQAPYEGSSRARSWPQYLYSAAHCAAWNLLWYNPHVAPKPPRSLPLSRLLENQGIAILRSGWDRGASVISLACGPPAGHKAAQRIAAGRKLPSSTFYHDHADFNDFTLFTGGRYVAIPSGYARRDSAYHNVIAVDGRHMKMDPEAEARIVAFGTAGRVKYAVGEAGRTLGPGVENFRRHVLLLSPDRFIICDFVRLNEKAGPAPWRRVEWFFHCDTPLDRIKLEGRSALLYGNPPRPDVQMEILEPRDFAWETSALKSKTGESLLNAVKLVVSEWYSSQATFLTAWSHCKTGRTPWLKPLEADECHAYQTVLSGSQYVLVFCPPGGGAAFRYHFPQAHTLLAFGLQEGRKYRVKESRNGWVKISPGGVHLPGKGGVLCIKIGSSSAVAPTGMRESRRTQTLANPFCVYARADSADRRMPAGGVYNLHLWTDNGPDYTDIRSFVRTATEGCTTDSEKCIAIWRWGRRSRRQTSCAREAGRLIWDPILHYNSYGTMNCGVIAALNISCWLNLGYRARYIQLGDHTVSEVSWDNGATWHMFDSSMSFFCYNHAGEVASCEEIKNASSCGLSGGRSEPGHFYLYHGAPQCISHIGPTGWRCASDQPVAYKRTLLNGASSFTSGYSVSKWCQYGRYGRRYILNLRPYESYTRYFRPLDRRKPNISEEERRNYFRPLNGRDPDEQHGLHNIRGNGLWRFEPDLNDPGCRSLFYEAENIALDPGSGSAARLRPLKAGRPARVVLLISAANVITSMHIKAQALRSDPSDTLRVLVSRTAGITWIPVWESRKTGFQRIDCKLRDSVAGVTQCLVAFEFKARLRPAGVGLIDLSIITVTQLNRRTLPKLTLGTNRIYLKADDQNQTTFLWPVLHGGRYKGTIFREQNVFCTEKTDGIYKATLGSAVNGKECAVTWRLRVPTAIRRVTYGIVATNRSSASYVSLRSSFDGVRFKEFFRKSDGAFPFDKQVVHTIEGPEVPQGARTAFLTCAFFCRGGARTYGMDGVQDVWIRIEHETRTAGFMPFYVTWSWIEHRKTGDVKRTHTEKVTKLPHSYTINTAGYRDPTMLSVELRSAVFPPAARKVSLGYSDGEDVGPGFEPPRVIYRWGRNIALGKRYTVSRPSSLNSGNPDSDGRELTNGSVIAPTDYTTQRVVQAATAFWDRGPPLIVTMDLGALRRVTAVRVATHQPNALFCHPQRVIVETSADKENWRREGVIHHDDLWTPPADYEPWEHDDDPRYEKLPAGGRLAYVFPLVFPEPSNARYVRFTFEPQRGKGMGLSELQVFDHLEVRRF